MRPRSIQFFIIISILCLLSCYSCKKQPASDFTALEESPADTTSLPCDTKDILPLVDKLLEGYTYQAHYINIAEQFVLSIWLVVPELDPYASGEDIASSQKLAFLWAAKISHMMVSRIPCVQELFDGINPMIVDKHYNIWYRGIIPIQALAVLKEPADEELLAVLERSGMDPAYRNNLFTRTYQESPFIDMSAWPKVHKFIQKILCNESGRCNAAVYPIIFGEYSMIQVYWEAGDEEEMDDDVVYHQIELLVKILSSSSIPVDRLEIGIVNSRGRLKIYSKVDGSVIHFQDEEEESMLRDKIHLYHMD
jgi:hypothetical protein